MKRIIFFVIILSTAIKSGAQVKLHTGDLLFQIAKSTPLSDAIAEVTSGYKNVNYTHVGIVLVEKGSTFVIEATPPKVRKTHIDTFLNDAQKINKKPIVAVARLRSKFWSIIPQAIKNAEKYIGKSYDYVYMPDNDAYYCSELVQISYLNKNGTPIFKTIKMTFRDKNGNMPSAWIEHFEKYKTPIPEGIKGTNPGEMSKSKQLDIIYRYFE